MSELGRLLASSGGARSGSRRASTTAFLRRQRPSSTFCRVAPGVGVDSGVDGGRRRRDG
jgi:hypothetical protein